ncbi:MAG TPA: PDZ domain-containing protein [Pirellulales bacterium]|nr:PDZ domain-containing protein [Pirellulales bacterium]
MRRIFWRFGVVALALAALATWSSSGFAREKDSSNDSQSNAQNASSDDSSNQNNSNNDRRNQDRDQSDDAQHHAALGISVTDNDGRVRVAAMLPGSPAAKAGLQVGDEIRYVDDQRIRTAEGLTDEVDDKQPGSNVELSIRRNGERRTLQARLASSQAMGASRWQNNRQYAANEDNNYNNRGNRWNQQGWNQNNWNRNRASSYEPNAQGNSQSVNQQIRTLRQQVAQLQQEVDDLRTQQAGGSRVGYRNRASNTSRDGNQSSSDRNDQDSD